MSRRGKEEAEKWRVGGGPPFSLFSPPGIPTFMPTSHWLRGRPILLYKDHTNAIKALSFLDTAFTLN